MPPGPYAGARTGYFDVANLHLYIGTPSFYWIITNLRYQLAQHGWGDKQVWVSETNVEPYDDPQRDATRPPTRFRVTMQQQAGFLVDALATYIAARVDRFAVYRMVDGPDTAHGLAPLGIVNNAGQERPYGHTFQFLVKLFRGATAHVDTTPDRSDPAYHPGELYADQIVKSQPAVLYKAGVFKVVCDKPGQRVTVLWNQFGPLNKAAEPAYTRGAYADGSRHYNLAGGVYHDAKDMIVLPTTDAAGVHYDVDGGARYQFKAHAQEADVYDKYGHMVTLRAGETKVVGSLNWDGTALPYVTAATTTRVTLANGYYTVQLRGGATYSNPDDPRIPTSGGDPVIIVEPAGAGQRRDALDVRRGQRRRRRPYVPHRAQPAWAPRPFLIKARGPSMGVLETGHVAQIDQAVGEASAA